MGELDVPLLEWSGSSCDRQQREAWFPLRGSDGDRQHGALLVRITKRDLFEEQEAAAAAEALEEDNTPEAVAAEAAAAAAAAAFGQTKEQHDRFSRDEVEDEALSPWSASVLLDPLSLLPA